MITILFNSFYLNDNNNNNNNNDKNSGLKSREQHARTLYDNGKRYTSQTGKRSDFSKVFYPDQLPACGLNYYGHPIITEVLTLSPADEELL